MHVYDKNKALHRKSVIFEKKNIFVWSLSENISQQTMPLQTFWKEESCTALIWPHDGAFDSIDSPFTTPAPRTSPGVVQIAQD